MNRTQRMIAASLVVGLAVAFARADVPADAVQHEVKTDVLLRALVDELDRNSTRLKFEDMEAPYFIEYVMTDTAAAYVTAQLGAVVTRNDYRNRSLNTDVRVGSYELDNTNFGGSGRSWRGWSGREASVPIEDDYNAIRQAIWWATDRDYKDVLESFAQKKAFMETKLIEDKPPDVSHESPVVHFDPRPPMAVDRDRMKQVAVALSQVFRNYAAVQESSAGLRATEAAQYLVNTEGTRLRVTFTVYQVWIRATVQADDGMKFSDSITRYAHSLDGLPSVDELTKDCGEMVKQLVAVRAAPKLESYTGPVLFDAEAASPLFLSYFGRRFGGGQRSVGSRTPPDDFSKKLNRRVLPRFLDVVDDPTLKEIDGVSVMGHYTYDDEGVPARRLTLVEAGRLKALLMSRNPSREFDKSTGHGRGGYASQGIPGCLVVTAREALDPDALKNELIDACQDEGLDFGIRIASLGGSGASAPLVIYKVFPDGREELVRGAEMGRIDIKAFKRMLAAGAKLYVDNNTAAGGQTIAAPAMLFEELDLAKVDRDFDKPPILPSPLER
jgi:TldD protein